MKLKKIKIKNFRSIKDVTIDFDPPCRILVGINESGKSNILRALSLLKKDQKPNRNKDQREALPNELEIDKSFVHFIFECEKSFKELLFKKISSKIFSQKQNTKIIYYNGDDQSIKDLCNSQLQLCLEVDVNNESKKFSLLDIINNSWNLLDGWSKPINNCPAHSLLEYQGEQYYLGDYQLICNDSDDIPKNYLEKADDDDLKNLLSNTITELQTEIEEYLPNVLFWEYTEKNLLPEQLNIDNFQHNPDSCIPLKNMFILSGIENITDDLGKHRERTPNSLQNYFERIAKKTTSYFRTVWREYGNVEFSLKISGNDINPGIKEHNLYDFAKRSDGFKRFITFLLMISVLAKTKKLKNTLLLVDEAEISLHPSGARHLRDELIKIANTNYVVYSTHSIFMIDPGNQKRHYIVKKENEITTVDMVEKSKLKDEEVLYNALGFSIFSFLNKKNIIFEGWRDKKLFQKYIEKAPIKMKKFFKDIGFCHAEGASSIQAITPLIELANRKCLIISDNDQTAKEYKKKYEKEQRYGQWKTYKDINPSIKATTGEDFIENNFIAKQIKKIPEIKNFNNNILPKKTGKLKEIKSWLSTKPINSPDEIIREIKRSVFENLRSEHINSEYETLVKGIISYLKKQQ